jgi:hypothetical protein
LHLRCLYSLTLQTRSLYCFSKLYQLFIENGVKTIPKDIFNLLEPVALAHWIQGDGKYVASGGLRLCTDSYTIQDVVRLMNVLMVRYELICTVHKSQPGQYPADQGSCFSTIPVGGTAAYGGGSQKNLWIS